MAFSVAEEGVTSVRVGTGVGGGAGGGADGSGWVGLSLPQTASSGRQMATKTVKTKRRRPPRQALATLTRVEEICFDRRDDLEETAMFRSLLIGVVIS